MTTTSYQLLADLVLTLHFAVVVFIVGALPLIVVGNRAGWSWVNHGWFRAVHLAAIAVVAVSSWVGIECPLTTLERWLRREAGSPAYGEEGFIEHWLTRLLFYEGPWWAFAVAYTLFALLVVAVWLRYPPRLPLRGR
ncbi:MAG TPA: DUF2784 domain-containing protein [Gammaproteobacteria bacterium]